MTFEAMAAVERAEETRDLRRQRTQRCYDEVQRRWSKDWRKEAAKRVKGVPVAIRMQGLMVVIATLMRENTPYARALVDGLAKWLMTGPIAPLRGHGQADAGARQLLDACRKASRAEFLAAEWEAILFFDNVKLYADALITDKEG
jgi:hypothetical protein